MRQAASELDNKEAAFKALQQQRLEQSAQAATQRELGLAAELKSVQNQLEQSSKAQELAQTNTQTWIEKAEQVRGLRRVVSFFL